MRFATYTYIMRVRFGCLLPLVCLLPAACTSTSDDAATSDDNALVESSKPRQGNTIASPSVDPSASYWGARDISILEKVGYLAPNEAAVARRADGILANQPPNGHLGVDELAVLESKADTLFPAEKAVLPKLWKILLIQPATKVSAGPLVPGTSTFDSYTPTKTRIPVTQSNEAVSRRVELTCNDDGDPNTISGADMQKVDLQRDSYLPEEVRAFPFIVDAIAAASGGLPAHAQRFVVDVPPNNTIHAASGASVVAVPNVYPAGSWTDGQPLGQGISLWSQYIIHPETTDPAVTLVALDLTSGVDRIDPGGQSIDTGTRYELWKGGARIDSFDAQPSDIKMTPIPFAYDVVIGSTTWVLNHVDGANASASYSPDDGATPTIPSGTYSITSAAGDRLDLFPNGSGIMTIGGKKMTCVRTQPWRDAKNVGTCFFFDDHGTAVGTTRFFRAQRDRAPIADISFGGTTHDLFPN